MDADPAVGIVGHGIIISYPGNLAQTHILREGFQFQANSLEGARVFRLRKTFLGTSRMLQQRFCTADETFWHLSCTISA